MARLTDFLAGRTRSEADTVWQAARAIHGLRNLAVLRVLESAFCDVYLALVGAPSLGVRLYACAVLGGLRHPDAHRRLSEALGRPDAAVQFTAAVGLAYLGDGRAVDPLRWGLDHEFAGVRYAAADALSLLGALAAPAVPALHEAMGREADRRVREAMGLAIYHIRAGLRSAPAELEASEAPAGRGTEPETAAAPGGTGTELVAAHGTEGEDPR